MNLVISENIGVNGQNIKWFKRSGFLMLSISIQSVIDFRALIWLIKRHRRYRVSQAWQRSIHLPLSFHVLLVGMALPLIGQCFVDVDQGEGGGVSSHQRPQVTEQTLNTQLSESLSPGLWAVTGSCIFPPGLNIKLENFLVFQFLQTLGSLSWVPTDLEIWFIFHQLPH